MRLDLYPWQLYEVVIPETARSKPKYGFHHLDCKSPDLMWIHLFHIEEGAVAEDAGMVPQARTHANSVRSRLYGPALTCRDLAAVRNRIVGNWRTTSTREVIVTIIVDISELLFP